MAHTGARLKVLQLWLSSVFLCAFDVRLRDHLGARESCLSALSSCLWDMDVLLSYFVIHPIHYTQVRFV